MNITRKLVVAGSAFAVTAAGVGIGVAYAAPTTSPTASPTASASTAPQKHQHRALARRVLHGEVTLANSKHTVLDLQRGAVSATSATKVSVKSKDGFSQSYVVDAKTKVVVVSGAKGAKKRAPGTIADVKSGAKVAVVAVKSGETRTAKRIVVHAG